MLEKFRNHIDLHFPHLKEGKFILACSGGVDSVVLAHLFTSCHLDFSLTHCNFKLRASESDKDEDLVRELAKELGKELFVTSFDTHGYMAEHKINLQIAARQLRYNWFSQIMAAHKIKTLVTAHHADDNLETFLINLSRGTGIEGLTGIPVLTNTISRPLLIFSRTEIKKYAEENTIHWREDASNENTKYVRNNIRHNIVPKLKELHPNFLENFILTQEYLGQTREIVNRHIGQLRTQLFEKEDNVEKVKVASLLALNPTKAYLFHFLREYGFTQWEDIYGLLSASSGKEVRSNTHRLLKDRDFLLLKPIAKKNTKFFEIEEGQKELSFPISLKISTVEAIEETSPKIIYIDKETLKYPLTIRKCQKGDYFYPLGMSGRKKISKYFKDKKMDIFAKENQWLLCSGGNIVWIIGKRADDRYKITDRTKEILKLILE
ncbi:MULTISPECIES: tRNA lysidine(34) synthetase TilS [unclassified Arenibacter]|uniref:tRNA lysidine(34) synthetase TilS n=1 Tax=unclassified Arenibacter TaxID=2615047 RepID=UPI000E34B42E|nr:MULTISPECIES: tRNA lysidine(34) synthetase TilS [unclassified Arenibacter]MCM4163024.1 tRNA lysidine(34) synthetase TilS [Arenibacter sp. A80]RFT57062.1 tRNA lysidine(34) synthetase TilS [Arenibacter sp. P308M17]